MLGACSRLVSPRLAAPQGPPPHQRQRTAKRYSGTQTPTITLSSPSIESLAGKSAHPKLEHGPPALFGTLFPQLQRHLHRPCPCNSTPPRLSKRRRAGLEEEVNNSIRAEEPRVVVLSCADRGENGAVAALRPALLLSMRWETGHRNARFTSR